jgi:hypothetical protein
LLPDQSIDVNIRFHPYAKNSSQGFKNQATPEESFEYSIPIKLQILNDNLKDSNCSTIDLLVLARSCPMFVALSQHSINFSKTSPGQTKVEI